MSNIPSRRLCTVEDRSVDWAERCMLGGQGYVDGGRGDKCGNRDPEEWREMKITRVRPTVMGTPWRNLTFLIIETDEGLSGVGEVRMVNNTDALLGYVSEAAPRHVIGKDPFDRELIVNRMFRHDF